MSDVVELRLDKDVPPPRMVFNEPDLSLPEKARAFCNTIHYLVLRHMPLEYPTEEDRKLANKLLRAFAQNPEEAAKTATLARMSKLTPPALRHIDSMLKSFGEEVVEESVQLRHYVTNKLVEETADPDPKIRLRALEMLGKITDVGLFTERQQVTVTHQTTDDLREALRSKLTKLVNPGDPALIEDAEVLEPAQIEAPEKQEEPEKPEKPSILDALKEFDDD